MSAALHTTRYRTVRPSVCSAIITREILTSRAQDCEGAARDGWRFLPAPRLARKSSAQAFDFLPCTAIFVYSTRSSLAPYSLSGRPAAAAIACRTFSA